ncbi:MAG: DUF1684 domain-containing protein [Actinomycetota bacterium]|nr:DUF1684 domain-containing protein [Actinomycetota bacterium]
MNGADAADDEPPVNPCLGAALELAGWRRSVAELYARVRAESDPVQAHARWRRDRDRLFLEHPQSPLPPEDPLRRTGLPYWPYDATLRFVLPLLAADRPERLRVKTAGDGTVRLARLGRVQLPEPVSASMDLWWLEQYAGGLFLPLRDGTAGAETYGGGRYLLDSAKGADLGGGSGTLVVDLNFLYHPSCRYDSAWSCPLAPAGNTTATPIRAGERV